MSWAVLGWLGQALFFLRFFDQWRASERAGRSVAPRRFWWLSLGGTLLVGSYTLAVREPILAGGYAASAWIYARNVALAGRDSARSPLQIALEASGVVVILLAAFVAGLPMMRSQEASNVWLAALVCGQLCWSSRFVVQWIASERSATAHFPRSFWWTSLVGNALLLAYALHRRDPLLVCAFGLGPLVQIRNLMLGRKSAPVAATPPAGDEGLGSLRAR